MNPFVGNPEWGGWIVAYFFLGGIAAGAYFAASLVELAGHKEDRVLARAGQWLALVLIVVCAVLLIVDLNGPTRFWHMLFKSEVVHAARAEGWPTTRIGWQIIAGAPLLKYWSPMSIGSWALGLFGLCGLLSLVSGTWPRTRLGRWLSAPWLAYPIRVLGCLVGFFVAAYTGTLLTATNQPVWSESAWIASLFLASAASTGLAAITLTTAGTAGRGSLARLHRADVWALSLELIVLAVFFASLGSTAPILWRLTSGKLLLGGTLLVGVLAPLAIHGVKGSNPAAGRFAAVLVLMGGLTLRWALVAAPAEFRTEVARQPAQPAGSAIERLPFGPEASRVRGGGDGADPGNRSHEVQPRSKVWRN